jgi:stage II sporulation protein M
MVNKKRVVNKKGFSLRKQYFDSWKYIKDSKNFIYFSIAIFFLFSLIGFFVPPSDSLSLKIFEYIEEILSRTEGLSNFGLIKFIFLNNVQSSFFAMVLGLVFGIVPLVALVSNGYIVGFVSSMSVENAGYISLFNLVPHGIFELPAIFISLGLGLKFGTFIFKNKIRESFNKYLLESLRVFVFVVLPLLIIAAIIEGFLIFL